jgi:DNA (cytosine-5)-methyltransferase 1
MMLRMLDLFAGIGGFSYAGEKLVGGYETVAFCEYDEHAQKVLRKHWPDTEIIGDIRELADDADRFRGMVDIVVGGYPCQPFSLAGVRRGDKDDRHLWPEMLRIIQAVRPTWVIGENVAGHISMGLDTVLSDLEAEGYQTRCFVIPAVAADAPHRRDRCWIVAHADSQGEPVSAVNEQRLARAKTVGHAEREQWGAAEARRLDVDGSLLDRSQGRKETDKAKGSSANVPNPDSARLQRQSKPKGSRQKGRQQASDEGLPWGKSKLWQHEPSVGRVANGVPGRVHRLKQLGNSIVPQVAARILWAIKEAHNEQTQI